MAHWFTSKKPVNLAIDLKRQSKVVSTTGSEEVREGVLKKDISPYLADDCRTLYEVFCRGARQSNNGPVLGWHKSPSDPYEWMSYDCALERMRNVGAGLVAQGLEPGQKSFVAIYAQNCPEWILAQFGCFHQSMTIVPIYDTLGPQASTFIINEVEIQLVVCDSEQRVRNLLEAAAAGATPTLQTIVHIKEVSADTLQKAAAININLISFEQLEKQGQANTQISVLLPQPADLAMICYTSGTTGEPKGVMLTHKSMVAAASCILKNVGDHGSGPGDVYISYLPLAHIFEHGGQTIVYMTGGAVGFYSGEVTRLLEDIQVLRPTLFPIVPRLLNRVYDAVLASVNVSITKRLVFSLALKAKKRNLDKRIFCKNTVWDKLVFEKVQAKLGGRVRFMFAGSAPLSGDILTFARCGLGCLVLECYGQTETCGAVCLTIPGDCSAGHVGPPPPHCQVKLIDAPENGYYAKDGKGEVCCRSPYIFSGYFKDPERTREVLDDEGWLKTGDIGMWLPNGTLKLIDRKRNIIKLSQGENVALEKLEIIYSRSLFIAQIFVYGDSLQAWLVAIIVPDEAYVTSWAKLNDVSGKMADLCQSTKLKGIIVEDLKRLAKASGLNSFEQVRELHLTPTLFSIENGLLTPTMKTKRDICRSHFKREIDAMYKSVRNTKTV